MITPKITPVILCGGSGTRLWPLSRKSFPKQFVPLIDNKSLLQLTLERVAQLNGSSASSEVICVAAEGHRFLVAEAMQAAKVKGSIILEPVARNTAPAMALAALQAAPQDLLLFCPSDHHIPDAQAFAAMVQQGSLAARQGAIVTFGVVPSFSSSAYGYIEQGAASGDGSYEVARFIEKPNADKAQALLLQGNVLWNAGIFLAQASTLLAALQQHAPDVLQSCQQAMAQAGQDQQFVRPESEAFATCRADSIDYAVLERHKQVAVVPFAGAWSDVGSWNAVADLSPADEQSNRIDGHGLAVQCHRTYIHAPNRVVVTLGTQDLLVIDTPDALLVVASSHAEQVKSVVSQLETRQNPEASLHRKVARPWGSYCRRRLSIEPGGSILSQGGLLILESATVDKCTQ
jgi:mannose-1-phosphate guanylyltransferase/mannose-6-phosphate isomerase